MRVLVVFNHPYDKSRWISFSNVKSRTHDKWQAWLTRIEHEMLSLV